MPDGLLETPNPAGLAPGRVTLRLGLGTALAMYNYSLIAFLLPFMGKTFFPGSGRTERIVDLLTLVVVGYAARPLGALVGGSWADRFGRKRVFLWSASAIAVPTALVAAVPGSRTIGAAAPIILLVLQIIQAFAAGIEYPGVARYVAEVTENQRGFYTSVVTFWVVAGGVVACFIALLVHLALPESTVANWGWRIPFAVTLLVAPLVYLLRRSLPESPAFESLARSGAVSPKPVRDLFRHEWRAWTKMTLWGAAYGTSYHITLLFSVAFLAFIDKKSLTNVEALALVTACTAAYLPFILVSGRLGDRIGPRPVAYAGFALLIVAAVPGFLLLSSGGWERATLGMLLFLPGMALISGPYDGFIALSYPTRVGWTGTSSQILSNSLISAPSHAILIAMLTTRSWAPPAFWLVGAGILGLVMTRFMVSTFDGPLRS